MGKSAPPGAACSTKAMDRNAGKKHGRAAPSLCTGPEEPPLPGCGDCIGQGDLGEAILIAGVGVGNVGFGFLEFGLAGFDDGAEAEIVAGLREIEGEVGLLAEFVSDGETREGPVGILPGIANIAGDIVL